jgi:hypothetical protein
MKAIAAWPCFIAEMQPPSVRRQSFDQLPDMIRAVRNRAPVANFTPAFAVRYRDRNRCLMNIQPDEHAILHVVSPPFLRLGTSQSGATLERRMPRERPQTQSPHFAIIGSRACRSRPPPATWSPVSKETAL